MWCDHVLGIQGLEICVFLWGKMRSEYFHQTKFYHHLNFISTSFKTEFKPFFFIQNNHLNLCVHVVNLQLLLTFKKTGIK